MIRRTSPLQSLSRIFYRTPWRMALPGVFFVGILHAQLVTIHLKDGDRLTGTLIRKSENELTLSNSWSKEIIIPLSRILRQEAAPGAGQADSKEAVPVATTPNPKKESKPAPAKAAAKKSVARKAATPPKKAWTEYWKGEVELGLDLLFGERDRQTYTGRAKATYVRNRFRNIFDVSGAYGETDGDVSADRLWGSSKTDFDLGTERRVFVYNLGGAGYDRVRKIDLKYTEGPGVGYHLIKRPTFVTDVEGGLNYHVEERTDNTRNKEFYFRLAESFTWKINSKMTLDEEIEFLPRADDLEDYRFRFESGLTYLLVKNLFLKATVIDSYDTTPANNVSRNDLQIRSSLNYKF